MVERVKGRDGIGEAKRVRGRKKRGGSSMAAAKGAIGTFLVMKFFSSL